jgi:hypothetical protein
MPTTPNLFEIYAYILKLSLQVTNNCDSIQVQGMSNISKQERLNTRGWQSQLSPTAVKTKALFSLGKCGAECDAKNGYKI